MMLSWIKSVLVKWIIFPYISVRISHKLSNHFTRNYAEKHNNWWRQHFFKLHHHHLKTNFKLYRIFINKTVDHCTAHWLNGVFQGDIISNSFRVIIKFPPSNQRWVRYSKMFVCAWWRHFLLKLMDLINLII